LQKAVAEWDAKEGQYFDSNGKPHSLKVFAATVRVPYDTFKHYVCKEKDKCRMIGKSVGMKPLLPEAQQKFICDSTFCWHGWANNRKSPAETIDLIQDINPDLNWKQAS
jgi:hypothetical protein